MGSLYPSQVVDNLKLPGAIARVSSQIDQRSLKDTELGNAIRERITRRKEQGLRRLDGAGASIEIRFIFGGLSAEVATDFVYQVWGEDLSKATGKRVGADVVVLEVGGCAKRKGFGPA